MPGLRWGEMQQWWELRLKMKNSKVVFDVLSVMSVECQTAVHGRKSACTQESRDWLPPESISEGFIYYVKFV